MGGVMMMMITLGKEEGDPGKEEGPLGKEMEAARGGRTALGKEDGKKALTTENGAGSHGGGRKNPHPSG